MEHIPEYQQMLDLSKRYSDFQITHEEFCQLRRRLLDQVDAKYNTKYYIAKELAVDIKNKLVNLFEKLKIKS